MKPSAAQDALPAGSRPAEWLVAERDGSWSMRLRRAVGARGPRIVETRSLAQLWERLADAPESFLVVELTAGGVEGLLGRLLRLSRDFPQARLAVVAPRSLAGYESLLREAGAVMFVTSPRKLGSLADVACRHLALAPPVSTPLAEQIWAELPWGT